MKPGYKQTEVGVIPDHWEVASVREIADIHVGRDLHVERFSQVSDATYRFPVYSNTVTEEGLYGFYSIPEYEGDSLTVVGRGVGLGTAFAKSGGYGAIGRLLVLIPNCRAAAQYLAAYINQRVRIFVETGGIPQLTGIQFSRYKVALPPFAEQHAIAAALGDVESLLEGLERLINKKRDLKQAAMQQLLTGQTRLPGFSGEWKVKRLGNIAPLQRGFDLPNPKVRAGPYPVVYSNGILKHHAHFQVQGPGVVTGRSGTIGRVTYVDGPYWPHNTALWVTNFNNNDGRFVYYLYTRIGFERFASGSGVPTLNRNDVHSIEVAIPPTSAEQTAIAAVLSDMDAELSALAARRDKTRDLKQAMMQELLTGRTRLV